jgi:hypothetical protein
MSWSDLGIIDPEIKWKGSETGKDLLLQLAFMVADIMDEINFYQYELSDLKKLGLWSDTIEQYSSWLDYLDYRMNKQSEMIMTRDMVISLKCELLLFRKDFDNFASKIGWYGDSLNGDDHEE